MSWICVHIDSQYAYLMTEYILWSSRFGGDTYCASTISILLMLLESYLGIKNNLFFVQRTVSDFTSYIHLATKTQMESTFSYFNSNIRRIGKTLTGDDIDYWLSSFDDTYAYYVTNNGLVQSSYSSNGHQAYFGIRPVITVNI